MNLPNQRYKQNYVSCWPPHIMNSKLSNGSIEIQNDAPTYASIYCATARSIYGVSYLPYIENVQSKADP